jgi:hypothetical protein|tara:strand:- start:2119 stop:4119 length:2001 start_codon:yes stop_codon:yes gene_type:complete
MAYFKLNTFGGKAPRIAPRLLADTLAQAATDVNLETGRLVPITENSTTDPSNGVSTLANTTKQTIFKYTDSPERWLQFDEDVDVVRGPIAGDTNNTIYWSGQSFPRMGRSDIILSGAPFPSAFFRLGVPAPTAAPTVAVAAPTQINATVTTTSGSGVITVTTASAHNSAADQFVTLAGFGATNGLTADEINGDFKIVSTPSGTTLTVETSGSATGNGTSGSITNGASFGGPSDANIDFETSYVYTFVTAYGEEGPPSPASTVVTTDDNQTVNLSSLETSSAKSNTNLLKKRIYRSNTGSNTTAFQFVAEVTLATTTYADTSNNNELAEVIPSTTWIAPPDDDTSLYPDGPMKGLCALPGGVFAGFTGKRICFSEPFLPHAWPANYRLVIEEEIVNIKVVSNGILATTKGVPYLITGSGPESMTAIRIESSHANLNKRSMVDMGPYVIYASPDGLIAAEGTTVRNITEGIITPTQWQANYYPATITGFMWEERYVGFFDRGSGSPRYGGFIFDPRVSDGTSFVDLDASGLIRGGHTDPDDSQLYLIISNTIKKFQGSNTNLTFNWKSKEYVMPKPTSMGFAKVDAETYPVRVKVYGDGSVIYNAVIASSGNTFTVTGTTPSFSSTAISEPVVRLPASVHKTYAVEVEGATIVNEICVGDSMDELRTV